jgi:hypothetical protein
VSEILYQNADGSSMQQNLADIDRAKAISEVLQRHYPGHHWAVNVNGEGGVATIKNFSLSGDWGFLLMLSAFSASELDKRVVMAGGELLERYNLSRGRRIEAEMNAVRFDRLGNAEFLQ